MQLLYFYKFNSRRPLHKPDGAENMQHSQLETFQKFNTSTLNATVDVAEIVKPKAHPEVAHRLDAVGPGQVKQVPEVVHRGVVHHELQRFGLWPLLPAHLV